MSDEESRSFIVARLSESTHFVAPLTLGVRLDQLRSRDDLAERQRLAQAIRNRETLTRWLDEEMVLARAHWDFWTYGISPAALVVINDGETPLVRQLSAYSGPERHFPFSFHIDDGDETRDYSFSRRGRTTIELTPVPPRSARLYIIWSDQARQVGRRQLGIKLSPTVADTLERLQRRADAGEWRRVARAVVKGNLESRRLDDDLRVAGAYDDLWTRGDQPAVLVVRNQGSERLSKYIAVESGERRDFPVRFYVDDGESDHEYAFTEPGRMIVELPPTPSRSERLFLLRADRPWTADPRGRRALGVRLSLAELD